MEVLETPSEVLATLGSGKAFNLARLADRFHVPPFVAIVPNRDGSVTCDPRIERHARGWKHVAVRSSADVEDSQDASFAGMFETQLGVTPARLWQAIDSVAGSSDLARVSAYQASQQFASVPIQVCVVIQKMVAADRSGVAFSRLGPTDDRIIVEAVFGLGEGLVSGHYTPDRYYYTSTSGEVAIDAVGYQKKRLVLADSGTSEVLVDPTARNSQKLRTEEIIQVAELAREVETFMDLPAVDIEWAYKRNHLYLLQARPYTGFQASSPQP